MRIKTWWLETYAQILWHSSSQAETAHLRVARSDSDSDSDSSSGSNEVYISILYYIYYLYVIFRPSISNIRVIHGRGPNATIFKTWSSIIIIFFAGVPFLSPAQQRPAPPTPSSPTHSQYLHSSTHPSTYPSTYPCSSRPLAPGPDSLQTNSP